MTSDGASWNEAVDNYDLVRGTTSGMFGQRALDMCLAQHLKQLTP